MVNLTGLDHAPALVLWFFDSRGEYASWFLRTLVNYFLGGMSRNPNPQPVPDWVDATVANWIKTESEAMKRAWGPQVWAAIAFVHIPPSVTHFFNISVR